MSFSTPGPKSKQKGSGLTPYKTAAGMNKTKTVDIVSPLNDFVFG